MASACRDCGEPVQWARLKGGKRDGKNQCFQVDPSEKGRYGLKGIDEKNQWDKQIIEAVYFDDPLKGLEEYEQLFEAHYISCPTQKGGKSAPVPAGPKIFVNVQVGENDYSGYLGKVSKTEDAPF